MPLTSHVENECAPRGAEPSRNPRTVARASRAITLICTLAAAIGCQSQAQPAPSQTGKYRDAWRYIKARPGDHQRLLAHEHKLRNTPVEYASRLSSERFYPQGLYFEPRRLTVWAYSRAHTEQRGFRLQSNKTWQPVGTRQGPLETRRCVALRTRDTTLCLGLMHKGGFLSSGSAPFTASLPARGGFRDFALVEKRARIYVIDSYLDALWTLDLDGQVIDRTPIVPGAYQLGVIDDQRLFTLSSNQPRLALLDLDDDGNPAEQRGFHTQATIRDAAFDATSGLLWTAGYREATVRRHRGFIENLDSFAYAYRIDDLALGVFTPIQAIDLSRARLADPVAIAIANSGIWLALSGSHKLARLPRTPERNDDNEHDDAQPEQRVTGLVPNAVLAVGPYVFSAGFLSGDIHIHRADDPSAHQLFALDEARSRQDRRRTRPYELGELLFYSKALWSDEPRNHFTCNSCHWDGLSDYRLHPGFFESRWEQIRPAAGAGMLAPVFTPGQAASLTIAIQGFIKSLDVRFWAEPTDPVWFADVAVAVAVDSRDADRTGIRERSLSTYEVRLALLTYLARRPVEPGYLRAPGEPLSASAMRGARLFFRDCARCHAPTTRMASRQRFTRSDALDYLRDRPLAFADGQLRKTGVTPYFTERGNRVPALTQLGRPGPFLSDGSAPSVRALLRRTDPRAPLVHAPGQRAQPAYSQAEVADLLDFLLSL